MTPEELRAEIPAVDETVYLNTGASGPSPRHVIEAGTAELQDHEGPAHAAGNPYTFGFEGYEATRERIAAFVGAGPESIALTGSTTDGISKIAAGLEWASDDVVVRTDLEHAAGILPWNQLRATQGIAVRVVETADGRVDRERFASAVEGARLVCLSAITWTHGTRLPVADLVEIAHDAGAMVLVDAVQVPGQQAMDVNEWGADFVAAAGHKWLLGPWGAGFLYIDEGVIDSLQPASVGYRGVEDPYADRPAFKPGAARFEIGTESPVPYAGLRRAIDLVESISESAIESRIRMLTDRLKAGVGDEHLRSPRSYESGLVSIAVEEPAEVVAALADRNIVVRSIPQIDAVRLSLHVFNTSSDVDAALTALKDIGVRL